MSGPAAEHLGDERAALANGARLLSRNPAAAARQAFEILKQKPRSAGAVRLLAGAYRARADVTGALAALEQLTTATPDFADAYLELGHARTAAGDSDGAAAAYRQAVALDPALSDAWRALGDHFHFGGDIVAADDAYARAIKTSSRDPNVMRAANALVEGQVAVAERLLRAHLNAKPTDVAAIRMLAEVAARIGRMEDAEALLMRCLELAPSFTAARHNLALVLHRQSKSARALEEIERLLAAEPHNPSYTNLKAAALTRIGEYDQAIVLYAGLAKHDPKHFKTWMSLGHALKTAGRREESIAAYRACIAAAPGFGEAYWSLANMKTFRFSADEIAAMQRQLENTDLKDEDALHFHYALGKAFEDGADYARSFERYAQGAALRRRALGYSADQTHESFARAKALFTPDFFAARAGQGAGAPDPIFIVGLPRAGSTLIEQVLASHSQVEGTMELPDILAMARRLGGKKRPSDPSRYPETLAELSAADVRALGEEYIARTQVQRKTDRPFFIDKMPNNFEHVGFIHLILPNAKIIDARRHPLGNCFSAFKQHFARGQGFTYDLEDIGRYWADYSDLMAHYDAVLPSRVHRVFYEQMVADTEGEVRRLLDYCGLPFEPGCLAFHENDRAVRTASSEQVRQPIFTDAVAHWRKYEPWLDPLKRALGGALETYPYAGAGEG